jgi:outer membrane receptor protein involved in Fe transport
MDAASAPAEAGSAPAQSASAVAQESGLAAAGAASAPAQAAGSPSVTAQAPEAAAAAVAPASAPASTLRRVVITGSRLPVQGAQGSVTTLGGREAALVPGAGVDSIKALQTLPGVASDGEGSSEPVVRGSRPGDNAYYVDFLPVGYLFHLGGALSVLPGELVQSFDLHSAAFGPQFADVTGAALDVTTRRPRGERLGGKVDASLLASGVVLEGPLGPGQSFMLAGRRSYWDLLVGEFDDEDGRVFNLPRYSDYQFKLQRQSGDNGRLTVQAIGAADHVDYRVLEGSRIGNEQPALVGEGRRDVSYGTQALQWEADIGDRGRNRLAVGRTDHRIGRLAGTAVDAGVRSLSYFVRDQLRLQPHPQHEVWLGGSLERRSVDLSINLLDARCTEFEPECDISSGDRVVVNDRLRLDQADVYVRDRWQLLPRWALTGGLRYSVDRYLHRRAAEPRLGLEWKATPDTLVTAAWGRHHQAPEGLQILAGPGNPGLDFLRARHAMLGLQQALDDGWSWRVEVYDKALQGLVVADPLLNYRNGGTGRAWGAELLLRKEADARGLSGWLSVSWSRATRRNDLTGEEFAFDYDQPLIVSLVALWQRNERWTFGARWNYHTGGLVTPVVGSRLDDTGRLRPVYGPLNSERLPPFHRLDLRADRRFSEQLSGYMELLNAYNRQNITSYSYNEDYSQREPSGGWPLLFTVGVQRSF